MSENISRKEALEMSSAILTQAEKERYGSPKTDLNFKPRFREGSQCDVLLKAFKGTAHHCLYNYEIRDLGILNHTGRVSDLRRALYKIDIVNSDKKRVLYKLIEP